ncbi:hypothetical protein ACFL4G_08330 [Thermodesulfobacteriota bacterium]
MTSQVSHTGGFLTGILLCLALVGSSCGDLDRHTLCFNDGLA